jgi:hypothetical protein
MPDKPNTCPKCQGPMQEGFILDTIHGNAHAASRWVAGFPEPSFWLGTKISDKEQHPIQSYRCTSCGYMESYATGE